MGSPSLLPPSFPHVVDGSKLTCTVYSQDHITAPQLQCSQLVLKLPIMYCLDQWLLLGFTLQPFPISHSNYHSSGFLRGIVQLSSQILIWETVCASTLLGSKSSSLIEFWDSNSFMFCVTCQSTDRNLHHLIIL